MKSLRLQVCTKIKVFIGRNFVSCQIAVFFSVNGPVLFLPPYIGFFLHTPLSYEIIRYTFRCTKMKVERIYSWLISFAEHVIWWSM